MDSDLLALPEILCLGGLGELTLAESVLGHIVSAGAYCSWPILGVVAVQQSLVHETERRAKDGGLPAEPGNEESENIAAPVERCHKGVASRHAAMPSTQSAVVQNSLKTCSLE